ncbi:MAG: hypothetical protein ABSD27_00790 [Bryobacteraceae bacterium]|jgi:hypothetical protein
MSLLTLDLGDVDAAKPYRAAAATSALVIRVIGYSYAATFSLWCFFLVFSLSGRAGLGALLLIAFLVVPLLAVFFVFLCAGRIEVASLGWSVAALVWFAAPIPHFLALVPYYGVLIAGGLTRGTLLPVAIIGIVFEVSLRTIGLVFAIKAVRACLAIRRLGRGSEARIF